MNIFIDIALSIDRTIYTWIPKIYDLIIRLASYEIFSADTINGLSRRIYALLGIFMLFKLSFSMVSYIVNPDDFSDKSKGFGGLIKNVIVSMVMIVAVPYIFAEAFYVQKMILDDGTIVKLIFAEGGAGDELNTDSSSVTYVNGGAGEEISFILFNQFVKPNDAIKAIKDDCRRIYKIGDDGKRVTDGSGTYELDEACDAALKTAFNGADNEYQHYIDAMKYQNYEILVNNPEIFKAEYGENLVLNQDGSVSASKTSVKVIKYNWFLCFIFGLVTLLFLVTLCIDVATRTIKLAFYQIIAPVPIISNCDPKAKKDGMFNKWIKACISTYLDLFIRLAMFYLAIFIIKSFADKFFTSHNESGVALFIVLGALVFAKQAPKIVEDLTGLKMEKFTLNPFKKISNEALLPEKLGKAVGKIGLGTLTGAAGGALAGAIGGGNNFGTRLLSAGSGALRGGIKSEGFGAGIDTQANVNRKMRDARIAGAGFWSSRVAGVASTFGLDDALLERQATQYDRNKTTFDEVSRGMEAKKNGYLVSKKGLQNGMAQRNRQKAGFDRMQSGIKGMEDRAISQIKDNAAGEISKEYTTKLMHSEFMKRNIGNYIGADNHLLSEDKIANINNLINSGYYKRDAANSNIILDSRSGNIVARLVTEKDAQEAAYDADHYLNEVGKYDYMSQAIAIANGESEYTNTEGQTVAVHTEDKTLIKSFNAYKEAMNNLAVDNELTADQVNQLKADGVLTDDQINDIKAKHGGKVTYEGVEGFERGVRVTGKALHAQFGQSKGINGRIETSMYADEDKIKEIDDSITKMETETLTGIAGWYYDDTGTKVASDNLTYEQAAKYLDAEKKDLDHKKEVNKVIRGRAADERLWNKK